MSAATRFTVVTCAEGKIIDRASRVAWVPPQSRILEGGGRITGTNRRGTELHEPPDPNVVVLGQVLPSNASDDDRVVVRDRADRVGAGFQFSPDLSGARLWSAGRRSRPKDLSGDEQERTGPLGRQASLDPSGLPAAEVVRPLEPELFEPPRGPRTHVSEVVVAVRDHRT